MMTLIFHLTIGIISKNIIFQILFFFINRFKPKSIVEYYNGDSQLPIYASPSCGYPVNEVVDTLLKPDIPSEHICTVQPLAVTQNAVFVVDVDSVNFEDLKADDLGSWTGTGTKKTYFHVLPSGDVRYSVKKPAPLAATQYFLFTRHYFIHKTYNKFHRMITDVRGWQDKFCVCLVILVNVYIVKLFITIA